MIIIDASVIFKWLVAESGDPSRIAWQLRDDYMSGGLDIVAPDILLYEIANILAYKTNLSHSDIGRLWRNFLRFEIPTIAPSPAFMTDCLKLSIEHNVSVYDATYIILAQKRHCALLTADMRLVKKAHLPFVRHLNAYTKI